MSSAAGPGTKNAHGAALREWAQQYSVESEPLGRGSFASVRDRAGADAFWATAVRVVCCHLSTEKVESSVECTIDDTYTHHLSPV